MAAKTRNSSVEALRIICIFGIIFMHSIAYAGDKISGTNQILSILANCIFNIGVTAFMLISGFYGVKFSLVKLIKLDLMVIFYSLLRQLIIFSLGGTVGFGDIVKSVLPIITNDYWYLTAYFIIAMLSPFLNRIPEIFDRKQYQRLLWILLLIFSIIPTFLYFEILGTEGKNVVQMIIVYLIGRYLHTYDTRTYKPGRMAALLAGNVILTFLLELAMYLTVGRFSMFYRDCSIFTVTSAILLFTLFRSMHFENRIVNRIATAVLAVYVFSFGFQRLVHVIMPLDPYAFSGTLFFMVFIFAVLVMGGCVIIDLIRQILFGRIEQKVAEILVQIVHKILGLLRKVGSGIGSRMIQFVENK